MCCWSGLKSMSRSKGLPPSLTVTFSYSRAGRLGRTELTRIYRKTQWMVFRKTLCCYKWRIKCWTVIEKCCIFKHKASSESKKNTIKISFTLKMCKKLSICSTVTNQGKFKTSGLLCLNDAYWLHKQQQNWDGSKPSFPSSFSIALAMIFFGL